MNSENSSQFRVRNTVIADFTAIVELCLEVYPHSKPWNEAQIKSHLELFPMGQLVVEEISTKKIVGMSASLIILWEDYDNTNSWSEFTDRGQFTNHDPDNGRTLYGAEVMVSPSFQGKGLGKMIYAARRKIAIDLGLLRIRAGARLRGFSSYAEELTVENYILKVINKEIFDPTLSFQLKEQFRIISIAPNYLEKDPESLGYAVVIEWLNQKVAQENNYTNQMNMQNKLFADLVEKNKDLYSTWERA